MKAQRMALAGLACVSTFVAGCATHAIVAGPPSDMRPVSDVPAGAAASDAGEPAFCVVEVTGPLQDNVFERFKDADHFHSIRRLPNAAAGHAGCDVLVKIDHPGYSVFTDDYVQALSGRDGSLLWEARGSGRTGKMGFMIMARQMRAAFQPGRPLFAKLAEPPPPVPSAAAATTAPSGAAEKPWWTGK